MNCAILFSIPWQIKMNSFLYVLKYGITVLALGAVWHAGALCFGEFILPKPVNVLVYAFSFVQEAEFWRHFCASAYRVCTGLAVSFFLAFPLGLYMGYKKRFDSFFAPFVFLTYPVPKIVFLPVLFLICGIGDFSRIFLIVLTVSYQITVVTRSSILTLDKKYFESFKSLLPLKNEDLKKQHFRMQKLVHLLIPAALPSALTALRLASGTAIAVLFMAESFAAQEGLGFLIMDSWGRGDTLPMFTGILSLCFLGICLYEFCNLLERRLCRWNFLQSK